MGVLRFGDMRVTLALFAISALLTGCPEQQSSSGSPAASAEPARESTASDKSGAGEPEQKDEPGDKGGW